MSKNKFTLGAGQSHEIEMAMNRPQNGTWTPELIHQLTVGNTLGQVRDVLLGHALIVMREDQEYVIDLDADPFVPNGWVVANHRQEGRGKFRWDPSEFKLFDPGYNKWGFQLQDEVKDQNIWNANLLDWFLANPDCIPTECEGKKTLFMGTLYRLKSGDFTTARYLYKRFGKWKSGIGIFAPLNGPVAVRVDKNRWN